MSGTLIDRMIEEPYAFALYQAIYLIENSYPDRDRIGTFGSPGNEVVRLTNVDSLSFPVSQVSSIECVESDEGAKHFKIATSILGLYGVFSPLPINYTESLVSWSDDDKDARSRQKEFLDIFNHRLLSLYYRCERYTRLSQTDASQASGPKVLRALVGFPFEDGRSTEMGAAADLSLARLLISATRSASGLRSWLSRIFNGIKVRIEEFCPRWVLIPEESHSHLGRQNSRLAGEGDDLREVSTLGEMMYDRETKFRIHLGPLKWESFTGFLPGRDNFNMLISEVDSFLGDVLSYDLMLKLLGKECYHLRTCLDGESSQLGFTAGLFREEAEDSDLCLTIDVAMTSDGNI